MAGIYIFTTVLLTLVWGVLSESFSLPVILSGFIIGICCVLFAARYLPLYKTKDTSILRLILYPFNLIVQIYVSALSNIKMILTDSYADIIIVKTKLKSEFLRVLLAQSITLTPGTVSLELKSYNKAAAGGEIVVLHLKSRNEPEKSELISRNTIKKLETKLQRAEKGTKK